MGGYFGVAAQDDCVFDLFFGVDYHSHLATRRAGIAVFGDGKFDRSIHNIENSPFRTKFSHDIEKMKGQFGIGSISDYEPQPQIVRSHHGTFAITTVGKINNSDQLVNELMEKHHLHFMEMSGGEINATELTAALINTQDNLIDGIRYAQDVIDGSMSLLLMNANGIYCARDKFGRTPVVIGRKDTAFCASFESFAYQNLGYEDYKELGPGEIDIITPSNCVTLVPPGDKMRICTFLWVYYGYPASSYEGMSVEEMRYNCGKKLAERDTIRPDSVSGIPDSGIAHAIGYSNTAHVPFTRPFIKYTPTWMRSFMPTMQSKRDMIAKMKLLTVKDLVVDKKLLLVDDSIVRGTQLRETAEYLFEEGAAEIHVRPACPPLVYACKYLNFSRSNSELDMISRRVIERLENGNVTEDVLKEYADPDSEKYARMVEEIRKEMGFTTLQYNRLDDLMEATGVDPERLCTYCWDGRE